MPMWLKSLKITRPSWIIVLSLLLGIGIRLYGAATPAQYYDMGTFHAWALQMLKTGPVGFYAATWSDYLPLPLYSFAPIASLSQTLSASFSLTFKLVLSLLEVILICWIAKLWAGRGRGLLFALLMLSPALLGDTAFWGQIDTIPALLVVLSFLNLSPFLFGLAVAIKPIMILVAPILWLLALKKGQGWQFPLLSGATFLATGIPMAGLGTIQLLWDRTLGQANTYPFTTINAWNLWSLVPNPTSWPPDNQIIFNISAYSLGICLFLALALGLFNHWRHTGFDPRYSLRVGASLLIIFYAVTTRMHERHLLFGLPLLSLASVLEPWLLLPLGLLTGAFTLNLYSAYYWVNHAQTWPVTPEVMSIVSWIVTLVALSLATIWHWPQFFKSLLVRLKTHKLLASILLLAALLRFTNLAYPSTYIFDEVYHAFTSREFLHNHIVAWEWWTTPPEGVAYEWTHPPMAKYGMVLGMLLFGENSFGWRVGSAAFGVASILGLYLLTLALTKNNRVALLAAFFLSIEGLHIAQSRIAMNDIYMLSFYIWSLYAAAKSRWKIASLLFGLALSSKWSALYGLIPLVFLYLYESHTWRHLLASLRYLLIVVFVYLLTFTPFLLAPHTWEQLLELHRQMWYYHTHLVATHSYQSTPRQWIFAARPVWYFVNYLPGSIANIYAQANPLILWLGLVALVTQFKKILSYPSALLYLLYLVFTLPWLFSPRIMFFYHYLPSVAFLCIILATWLVDLSPRSRYGILLLCFLGFITISPMLYGFPLLSSYWDTLFRFFPSWK